MVDVDAGGTIMTVEVPGIAGLIEGVTDVTKPDEDEIGREDPVASELLRALRVVVVNVVSGEPGAFTWLTGGSTGSEVIDEERLLAASVVVVVVDRVLAGSEATVVLPAYTGGLIKSDTDGDEDNMEDEK